MPPLKPLKNLSFDNPLLGVDEAQVSAGCIHEWKFEICHQSHQGYETAMSFLSVGLEQ